MSDRPVLAIVTDAVEPWHKGGKETRTAQYSRVLSETFDVHIFTMHWWPGPAVIERDGVTLHAISPLVPLYRGPRRSITQALVFSASCLRLITHRFDLAEVDQIPIIPLLAVKTVCLAKRRPMVATWHEVWGTAYWREYLGGVGRVAAWAERRFSRLPDRIIAASTGTANNLTLLTDGCVPVTVGENGVDLAEIAEVPAASRQVDLLFVGRLLEHKGLDILIRAVAELKAIGQPQKALIVGRGPEEDSLRQLVESLDLVEDVIFVGALDARDDVLSLMKAAKLFVFPSRREGFGLVVLEAMACGTPVVTTNHADNWSRALVEVGRNGLLCEPDGSDLAQAILTALRHRDELAAGALETARHYSWDAAVARALPAYTDCLPAAMTLVSHARVEPTNPSAS
ncbi:MAG: glycosyltransferase family 4 protein [Proteobacteria bacterium]|nr:glycosyltransferase family 4 protein [Pseudomonadota bacterium]